MNRLDHFFQILPALPETVRKRMERRAALDWQALADRATLLEVAEGADSRLPSVVEALAAQLVLEVGIVPAEVASGLEGSGAAGTWIHWIAVEPDGEGYRLRNERSGELYGRVRPEALFGYTVLGLELATLLHGTCDALTKAGGMTPVMPTGGEYSLAQCVTHLHLGLRAVRERAAGAPSTLALARVVEDAWNAQSLQERAALASYGPLPP